MTSEEQMKCFTDIPREIDNKKSILDIQKKVRVT